MIPVIAGSGASFKGAAAYYLHDKGADSRERVAWTHTENLLTDNADQAWKVMAWTASHQATLKAAAGSRTTGRKLQKPVFALSLSWSPDQKPDKAHMLATAKAAAAVLGLAEHQTIIVCHNDEPQPHVHLLVNRVHPDTGLAATLSRSKAKLAEWALDYEQKHGKVYCQARAKNAQQRAERARNPAAKEKHQPEGHPVIAAAWRQSDSGRSFQAALQAQGCTLAQGNRRLVVIDRYGKATNPVRALPGVRAAAFMAKLHDLDRSALPTAAKAQKNARAGEKKQYAIARKFDQWAAEYLNKNQDRHIEERAAMHDRYARQATARQDYLAKHYKLADLNKAAAQLHERIDSGGIFRRLSGAAKKDRSALNDLDKQLADVKQRTAEQVGAITTERDYALADLAERHQREDERAAVYIAERKPAFYAEENAPAQERAGRVGGRDRDDGGRERVHYRTPTATFII